MARPYRAVLARQNYETQEGDLIRVFPAGCFEWRDLPLPLTWDHSDFMLGRIDTIAMEGDDVVAYGILDDEGTGEDADRRRDLVRQIGDRMVTGVSVEPGAVEYEEEIVCIQEDDAGFCEAAQYRLTFTLYRIGAASVVTVPGIDGALIELDPPAQGMPAQPAAPVPAAADAVAASAVATADVIPAAWLVEPADLPDIEADDGRIPHILESGRVFGYLASWQDCLISVPDRCQTPWHSATDYEFALHCGPFQLDDGSRRQLAPLAVQGGHYPVQGVDGSTGERYARQWRQAQAHYDDPNNCAAYVNVGENEHGIWFAGALRHGVTPEHVAMLRRHQLSGDWRRPNGQMELLGMCSVNFPGFIRRVAYTASATPGEFLLDAAVLGGPRARLAAAPCCEACAASGGHCDAHPELTLAQEVAALRSLVETLARNTPGVRDGLRARLAG